MKKGLEGCQGNEIKAIAGKLADAESITAVKVKIPALLCKLWAEVNVKIHKDLKAISKKRDY